MKKSLAIVLSLGVILVIVVSAFAAIQIYSSSLGQVASKKPFYVGVTYCGSSTTEAEQLIDKVKNYANLFVLDSGPLMQNVEAMEQICDYAVNSGLNVIACFTTASATTAGVSTNEMDSFLNVSQSWGSHFSGLYLNDEPGGKMLDSQVNLHNNNTDQTITTGKGFFTLEDSYNESDISTETTFDLSGEISLFTDNTTFPQAQFSQTTYYPNGTISYVAPTSDLFAYIFLPNGTTYIDSTSGAEANALIYQPDGTVQERNGTIVTDAGNISQFEPYQQLWNSRPIQTYTDAANLFVANLQFTLSSLGNQSSVNFFTSDYGLYWFDYQGGYNSVFAELFGTQGDAQTLALDRGAADMQNKSWGVMIEPASQSPLLLQNGNQIYNEMRQAYENGAEYAIVFNYSPSGNGTGLLQDEQFASIQKFWIDVVQNPKVTNNVTGQDALVLPNDYGSGLRSQNDTIWGIWQPDNSSQQVWNALQSSLAKYGSKLDIVYEDPAYPTSGRYQHVYYWNQTI
jgi:hypothetical protein